MFAATSHPYLLQLAALWLSFVLAFGIVALIVGAQVERFSRKTRRAKAYSASRGANTAHACNACNLAA